jgi:hypothetical protein
MCPRELAMSDHQKEQVEQSQGSQGR